MVWQHTCSVLDEFRWPRMLTHGHLRMAVEAHRQASRQSLLLREGRDKESERRIYAEDTQQKPPRAPSGGAARGVPTAGGTSETASTGRVTRPAGFEPATFASGGRRSIH